MSQLDRPTLTERHLLARQEVLELRHLLALHMTSSRADRLPDELAREVEIYLGHIPIDADERADSELSRIVSTCEAEARYARGLLRAVLDVIGPTQLQALYDAAKEAHTNAAGVTLGEMIAELEREHGVH